MLDDQTAVVAFQILPLCQSLAVVGVNQMEYAVCRIALSVIVDGYLPTLEWIVPAQCWLQ